jgi:hypothetical protein
MFWGCPGLFKNCTAEQPNSRTAELPDAEDAKVTQRTQKKIKEDKRKEKGFLRISVDQFFKFSLFLFGILFASSA